VFAAQPIPSGARLMEYVGERISSDEADRRYPDDPSRHSHTFLFAVEGGIVIDGTTRGSLARWINHSCDPNCETVDEGGRIFVESIREIAAGEELTYNYYLILEERHTATRKRRYFCRCGAANCRGTMLASKRRSGR
jgi:uncharacterized protein